MNIEHGTLYRMQNDYIFRCAFFSPSQIKNRTNFLNLKLSIRIPIMRMKWPIILKENFNGETNVRLVMISILKVLR